MKIKTSELIGAALDWAVASCENLPMNEQGKLLTNDSHHLANPEPYSTDWAQGGPIIEREVISMVAYTAKEGVQWQAGFLAKSGCGVVGPTALTAAMRCLVASKLGDEVEVPDELKT